MPPSTPSLRTAASVLTNKRIWPSWKEYRVTKSVFFSLSLLNQTRLKSCTHWRFSAPRLFSSYRWAMSFPLRVSTSILSSRSFNIWLMRRKTRFLKRYSPPALIKDDKIIATGAAVPIQVSRSERFRHVHHSCAYRFRSWSYFENSSNCLQCSTSCSK